MTRRPKQAAALAALIALAHPPVEGGVSAAADDEYRLGEMLEWHNRAPLRAVCRSNGTVVAYVVDDTPEARLILVALNALADVAKPGGGKT